MFEIKKSKVLLGRYVNKKVAPVEWADLKRGKGFDDKHCTCDCLASYRTDLDVKVGDLYTVYHSGRLAIMQVDAIIPRWEYSNERYGAGDFDTMSTVISKVDLDAHKAGKDARNKIRDIKAAVNEILEKFEEDKAIRDAINGLDKDNAKQLKDMLDAVKALEENPNAEVAL